MFDVYDRDGYIFPPSYYLTAIRRIIAESDEIRDEWWPNEF